MGLFSILYTSRDALQAHSRGLQTTGQNIANVNTPGYARRAVILEPRPYGPGAYGGVDAVEVRRITDRFLEQRYFDKSGLSSSANERDQQLAQIDGLFDETLGARMGGAMDQFFTSFSTLAARPNDPTTRAQALASADVFAAQVRDTANTVATLRTDLATQASSVVKVVNDLATNIAKINQQIEAAENAGSDAVDLKDQRNTLLQQLSEKVNINVITAESGRITVQAAGATLIDGDVARALGIDVDSNGALKLMAQRSGGPAMDATSGLSGGTLDGIFQVRDSDLTTIATRLDNFAYDIATAVNTQHAAGFGLDGINGRNLFSVSPTVAGAARSLSIDAQLVGHPERLAASSSAAALPGGADNALSISKISAQAVSGGGTRTPAEDFAALLGQVGQLKAGAASTAATQEALKAQAKDLRETVSGVSLDEEMISLTQYQRAYEASTKVLQTVDQLLDELIQRLGR
ncbi:MAG: flagellar hook-associated protein FlgK [Polyangiaceae bacterium]|nr:flagellar hook-associated protein FlgK [Polyangiaceae bacterium]